MKILLGADTYAEHVNGAARFTSRLAAGLSARGHEVHLVGPSDTGKPRTYVEDGITFHRLASHHYPFHETLRVCIPSQALPATRQLVERLAPDVVHIQSHMVVGRGLAMAAAKQHVPLVATNHFMPENVLGYIPFTRFFPRTAARWAWRDLSGVFGRADLVTAPTPRAVELLESSTTLRDIQTISCGIDTELYWEATLAAPAGIEPTILFVGRLDQEKRVDQLLRAFAALPAGTAARLDIIGDGDRRGPLGALAQKLNIRSRVDFRGYVDDQELLQAYGRCDIFCMPGVAELQSIVTLEAMAAGKPVVAADAMALPHLVKHGRNGWLFTPGDIAGLSQHLGSLIDSPQLRQQMGQASREIVGKHAINATIDSFEDAYQQVCSGTSHPRVSLTDATGR